MKHKLYGNIMTTKFPLRSQLIFKHIVLKQQDYNLILFVN
jgi:hypothetical protein